MIKYEFKKLLEKKIVRWIIILGGCILIYHSFFLHMYNDAYGFNKESYNRLADNISYEVSIDDLEQVQNINVPFFPSTQYYNKRITHVLNYSSEINELISIAKERISKGSEIIKHTKIIKIYEGRKLKYFANTRGWEFAIKDHYIEIFLLLIISLSCSQVFTNEKEKNMDKIILVSSKIHKTIASKILGSYSFVSLIYFIYLIIQLVSIALICGLENGDLPIVTTPEYKYYVFYKSYIEVFIINSIIRLFGYFILINIAIIISSYFKKNFNAFFTTIVVIISLTLYHDFNYPWLNILNPINLLMIETHLQKLDFSTIYNYPIHSFYLIMGNSFLFFLLTIAFVYRRGKQCFIGN